MMQESRPRLGDNLPPITKPIPLPDLVLKICNSCNRLSTYRLKSGVPTCIICESSEQPRGMT